MFVQTKVFRRLVEFLSGDNKNKMVTTNYGFERVYSEGIFYRI